VPTPWPMTMQWLCCRTEAWPSCVDDAQRPTTAFGESLLHVEEPVFAGVRLAVKTVFDRCVAMLLMILLSPLLASLGQAATNPALGPTPGSRLTEWVRDHGGGGIVTNSNTQWNSTLTVGTGTFSGSIVIRNGLIAEVGDKVLAPMGAKIIDLGGKHITPGLIDCHTHIALVSTNEGSVSVSSMVAMRDVIDPEDPAIFRDLAGGTTTANLLHGSANAIGGLNVVIKMRWGSDADGLVIRKPSRVSNSRWEKIRSAPDRAGNLLSAATRRRRATPARAWAWRTSFAKPSSRRGNIRPPGRSMKRAGRAARTSCRRAGI